MNFNSLSFLIFLPIVVFLYWIFPKKFRWVILLVASYYFYMSWNPELMFLILGTTLTAYVFGILMEKTDNKKLKTTYLILTLVICLGVLVFFKYFNFLVASVTDFLNLFRMHLDTFSLNLILPVGISFYTFQTLSYVIDVYKGKYKAEKHFGYFALYVSYFPQLVAGPIERPETLIPQLKEAHKLNSEDLIAGIQFLLIGFFRKCVIADTIAPYVDGVFGDLGSANSLAIALAACLFLVQIYCDFAGYSEIAMGSARLMGVKLTRNFDRPLLSQSYTEYFRRWHITLNQWFTDYVYIPLGGNRKGKARKVFNTMVVFFLCGLWHGASWTYVCWGLYGGAFVSVESLLRKPCMKAVEKHQIDLKNPGIRFVRTLLLWLSCIPACIFFRAASMGDVGLAFTGLFTRMGVSLTYISAAFDSLGMTSGNFISVIVLLVGLDLLYRFDPVNQETMCPEMETKKNKSVADMLVMFFLILAIACSWLNLIAGNDASAFAYFQF